MPGWLRGGESSRVSFQRKEKSGGGLTMAAGQEEEEENLIWQSPENGWQISLFISHPVHFYLLYYAVQM